MNSARKSTSAKSALCTTWETDFLILGMNSDDDLRSRLASDLQALAHLIPIEHAHISLERQHAATPPFQAAVMLVVPGPDIHVAARDHTWPAAWQKVLDRLREQVEQRRSRLAKRRRDQPRRQPPVVSRAR
ncbi:MAG: HPF/RaiA family ribosome-associated protein [Verrucomicrobiales bacterium]|nr:HPF/RaiA family ribosome-associated protein [Verrucomicrobiales bacterium]